MVQTFYNRNIFIGTSRLYTGPLRVRSSEPRHSRNRGGPPEVTVGGRQIAENKWKPVQFSLSRPSFLQVEVDYFKRLMNRSTLKIDPAKTRSTFNVIQTRQEIAVYIIEKSSSTQQSNPTELSSKTFFSCFGLNTLFCLCFFICIRH